MKKRKFNGFLRVCFALIIATGWTSGQTKFTLSGKIKDLSNGEDLIGATIYIKEIETGALTNPYGFYSLTIPEGKYTLLINFLGYKQIVEAIDLKKNMALNFQMEHSSNFVEEVVITGEREDANVKDLKMSKVEINMEQVKKLPPLFGEPDVIKIVQLQPGVVSAGEGTSSFFVRGGGADQNLILIDEAPVYDPSHFFGLFSVFNSDIVKSSELYKGGIPSLYGGRLSSMMDVRIKDGNSKKFSGSAGIGLLAAKGMIEGPIANDRASFLLSARRSYAGYYMKLSPEKNQRNNNVYFYDYNGKVNYTINDRNRIYVSSYYGRDVFKFGDDFMMDWGNFTTTVRWNHMFSEKLFSNTTLIYSDFDYSLKFNDPVLGFKWTANIREYTAKEDLSWFIDPHNFVNFGFSSSYKRFNPGIYKPTVETSIFATTELPLLYAWDNAFYVSHKSDISYRLSIEYGIRLSLFAHLGPYTIYDYKNQDDPSRIERVDSTIYESGDFIKTFINPEPRFSAKYSLDDRSSLKASYNRMVQYTQQMTTGTTPLPTAIWLPSTTFLKPQTADQAAVGYFRNFVNNAYEFSLEGYYKDMNNVVDFADNSEVFFNKDLPAILRQGTSNSYGIELMLKKIKGPLNGWISYTWSHTTRDIPGVNLDRTFFASYDRRHNINVVGTYDLSGRLRLGAIFTYGTGRPLTMPSAKYQFRHYIVDEFTERNGYRLPDFHRLDLSATLKSKGVPGRKWQSEWNFSIYNVYNRKNPFTIYTRRKQDSNGQPIQGTNEKEAVMIYLFPIMPSVSYNIKF